MELLSGRVLGMALFHQWGMDFSFGDESSWGFQELRHSLKCQYLLTLWIICPYTSLKMAINPLTWEMANWGHHRLNLACWDLDEIVPYRTEPSHHLWLGSSVMWKNCLDLISLVNSRTIRVFFDFLYICTSSYPGCTKPFPWKIVWLGNTEKIRALLSISHLTVCIENK